MGQRQLESIFCDDIRHEVGGKVSYIGVYNGQMWALEFPITLPKLCVGFKLVIPNEKPIEGFKVTVMRDDSVIHEMEITGLPDPRHLESVKQKTEQGIETISSFQNGVVFSPFLVEEPCTIRLRVSTSDGDLLKATALIIGYPPPEFAPPPTESIEG